MLGTQSFHFKRWSLCCFGTWTVRFLVCKIIPPKKTLKQPWASLFWTNCVLVTGNCKKDLKPTLFYKVGHQLGPLLVRNGARIHTNGLTWTFKSGCHEKTLRNGELTLLNGTIWHPFEGAGINGFSLGLFHPYECEL